MTKKTPYMRIFLQEEKKYYYGIIHGNQYNVYFYLFSDNDKWRLIVEDGYNYCEYPKLHGFYDEKFKKLPLLWMFSHGEEIINYFLSHAHFEAIDKVIINVNEFRDKRRIKEYVCDLFYQGNRIDIGLKLCFTKTQTTWMIYLNKKKNNIIDYYKNIICKDEEDQKLSYVVNEITKDIDSIISFYYSK